MVNNNSGPALPVIIVEGADGLGVESSARAFWSAVITLTLGILGSSVLPIPWAFSRTGLLPGLSLMLLVALSNSYTGTLLIRAAGHLNKRTYEGVVATAFRSSAFRVLSQLALISLLFGTLAGDAALLADTGTLSLKDLTNGQIPKWIAATNGRIPMLVLTAFIVVPLSLSERLRSLERAAAAGTSIVVALTGVIVWSAVKAGLPAIKNGEFPITKFAPGASAQVPEAIAVLSFSFYLQPMLLPLLSEMPQGRRGQDVLCNALQLVTVVIAYVLYSILSIFGAARWGLSTEGDILLNHWLPGRASGLLDAAMVLYLSVSMAPMAIAMRYLLASLSSKGELQAYVRGRDAGLTIASIVSATCVACIWPTQAEKLFAVTGATGVCLVGYVLPVAVHFKLYFTRRRYGAVSNEQEAWLLEDASMLEGELLTDPEGHEIVFERRQSSVVEVPHRTESLGQSGAGAGASVGSSEYIYELPFPERPGGYPHWKDLRRMRWGRVPGSVIRNIIVPAAVLCLGVGTSAWALVIALAKLNA